ncbi:MAG: zinc-finger-containing protein [Angelakisella sp.]
MKNKGKKTLPPRCPYCGHTSVLRPASWVHGDGATARHLYVCSQYPVCNSYVGAHDKTLAPLGTLAGPELRHKRIKAHQLFDRIWQSGIMSRDDAYSWLKYTFGLTGAFAHIGVFSDYYCEQLILRSRELLRNNKIAC